MITLSSRYVTELADPYLRKQKPRQYLEVRSIGSLCQEFEAITFTSSIWLYIKVWHNEDGKCGDGERHAHSSPDNSMADGRTGVCEIRRDQETGAALVRQGMLRSSLGCNFGRRTKRQTRRGFSRSFL
jgi:hypothetical protein